jgi:3-dehydroquinate dehydratase-1
LGEKLFSRTFWERELRRPFLKDKYPGRICLPIVERSLGKALSAIEKANGLADLIELRLDYLREPELPTLLKVGEKPFIVTNRRKEEEGKYRGEEKKRLEILRQAVDLGVAYVDVETRSKRSSLLELIKNKRGTRLVLSFHDFERTLSPGALRVLCGRMIRYGADVIKIATLARSFEDNLKILSLIPYARERNQEIVAFAMGEKGKMSRIFAPLMGAAWTYASLDRKRTSAPGQLTAGELREIWERLR